ncbi:MAG: hypothetical protein II453_21205, partial [Alphaproteobacteria bacterium]|nr:hypothetical protein [Alphaproteobacteria bacterium]
IFLTVQNFVYLILVKYRPCCAALCYAVLCLVGWGGAGWEVAETQLYKGYKTVTNIVTEL